MTKRQEQSKPERGGLQLSRLASRAGADASRRKLEKRRKALQLKTQRKFERKKVYNKLVAELDADREEPRDDVPEVKPESESKQASEFPSPKSGVEVHNSQHTDNTSVDTAQRSGRKKSHKGNRYSKEMRAYEQKRKEQEEKRLEAERKRQEKQQQAEESRRRRKGAAKVYRSVNRKGQPKLGLKMQKMWDELGASKK
mmetsp:Transcript_8953/g.26892  ORF Transcript_8953/g.26892 Transcript_8953/m.26892 type:complete len:198 (-) Transcript_8953:40-633(-)